MKHFLLILAATPLFAQDAPAPAAPAAPTPPPATEKAEPPAPELPKPAPRDDKLLDLLKSNPAEPGAGIIKPKPEKTQDIFGLPTKPQPAAKDSERAKNRTTLKPPASATELDLRVRYRKARSAAERDPAVAAAWEQSRTAATDYEKREALKRYYHLLYGKMLALDRGIGPVMDDRRAFTLKRLDQTRVEPTEALD